MATKIQLDGPALERLIGGDSEIEIALRHQVANNFGKHYLKKALTEEIKTLMSEKYRQELIKVANEAYAATRISYKQNCDDDFPNFRIRIEAIFREVMEQQFKLYEKEISNKIDSLVKEWAQKKITGYLSEIMADQLTKVIQQTNFKIEVTPK